jgi:hypothetical protein
MHRCSRREVRRSARECAECSWPRASAAPDTANTHTAASKRFPRMPRLPPPAGKWLILARPAFPPSHEMAAAVAQPSCALRGRPGTCTAHRVLLREYSTHTSLCTSSKAASRASRRTDGAATSHSPRQHRESCLLFLSSFFPLHTRQTHTTTLLASQPGGGFPFLALLVSVFPQQPWRALRRSGC